MTLLVPALLTLTPNLIEIMAFYRFPKDYLSRFGASTIYSPITVGHNNFSTFIVFYRTFYGI